MIAKITEINNEANKGNEKPAKIRSEPIKNLTRCNMQPNVQITPAIGKRISDFINLELFAANITQLG